MLKDQNGDYIYQTIKKDNKIMTFIKNLANATNKTTTENGAATHLSSQNPLLDFFALGGSTRKNPELGMDLFKKALAYDKVGAIRTLFYFRDIRGGQGERTLFRNGLKVLASEYPDELVSVLDFIKEYGRYDDLVSLADVDSVKEKVMVIIQDTLADDYTAMQKGESISLLAKWLPSENATSKATKKLATVIRKALGATPKSYRQTLTKLRAAINIVETPITNKNYDGIDYSKLPSQAGFKYRKAFKKNDSVRYAKFMEKVEKGEATINAGTLSTYQIYDAVKKGDDVKALDALWNALPDYTRGNNALVVADVSGSMSGTPMSMSVSLALYFAERNKGQFKDYFMTFSSEPRLQKVVGKNIREKMNSIETASWQMSTNIEKVFGTILNVAISNKTSEDEMPSTVYIISDMEFDSATRHESTNFEFIDQMYKNAGYKRPHLVFWNVDARNKQVPVTEGEGGTSLVSGSSQSTFKLVVENKTPEQTMLDVINSERYCKILA